MGERNLYAIQAVRDHSMQSSGRVWHSTEQLPTFYLDADVQGIVDETHAARIALKLLDDGSGRVRVTSVQRAEGE